MSDSVKNAQPREKPLLLWDGDCRFCGLWVQRWQCMSAGQVDFARYQEKGSEFPQITPEEMERAVHLIGRDGEVYPGAEAIYKMLSYAPGRSGWFYCYKRFASFARVSDVGYRFVARHRGFFSVLTRLLWGRSGEPSTYLFSSWLFPKLIGAIGLVAVLSFWLQAGGLIGSEGILPVSSFMEKAEAFVESEQPEQSRFSILPTVFWWGSSDAVIHWVCLGGVLASCALIFGLLPPVSAIALWLLYLSLQVAGRDFMSFQWDILLIEVTVLTFFYSAWRFWGKRAGHWEPSRVARWLCWLLLFKLMFQSGVVKLQSFGIEDANTWRDWTALNYHYWTQPIPVWSSWYLHHLPDWFQRASLAVMFFIELVLPFLFLGPRRLRTFAFGGMVALQLLIMISGNYGFFNFLTLFLAVPLLADQSLPRKVRTWFTASGQSLHRRVAPRPIALLNRIVLIPFALLYASISLYQIVNSTEDSRLKREEQPSVVWMNDKAPEFWKEAYQKAVGLRSINSYGLFRVMTTTRPEIVILGSVDGREWRPYRFKYKVESLDKGGAHIIPHMPRLDWRMWFAASELERAGPYALQYFNHPQRLNWLKQFLAKLSENSPSVTALLKENPFADEPPHYFRLELYHYTFTDPATRKETDQVWSRKQIPDATIIGSF